MAASALRRFVPALVAAGGLALVSPALSSAAPGPALEINAVDGGACNVTFSIENRTSRSYSMDYWIDNEPLTGQDYGTGPTGRVVLAAGVAPGTPPSPYRRDIDPPFHTEKLVDLKTVANLPNPDAATHVVHYRIILGPESDDLIRDAKTTTVTGCGTPGTGSSGSSGSSDLFPANFLGGLLG